jgi:Domain of unknown function (DUF5076)
LNRHAGELLIPPDAAADISAAEILRVWASGGRQHAALRIGVWSDPAAWGMLLVDLARHVANAYEQEEGRDRVAVLARVRAGFEAEWSSPTDRPGGQVVE